MAEHVRAETSIRPDFADGGSGLEVPGQSDESAGALADSRARALRRLSAAVAVEWYVRRRGTQRVCVFDDAEYYWALAGTIRRGTLYEVVEWGDIPHFALRVPGYPAFLAACQTILGERPLAARLVQAGLGVLTVWLMYQLSREVAGKNENPSMTSGGPITGRADGRSWTVPLVAASLAAVHPYFVVMSVLILSEAVFFPLMLAALWGMAAVWNETTAATAAVSRRALAIALGVGAASGAAILVRPSWALFVPVMLVAWSWSVVVSRGFPPRLRILNAAGVAAVVLLGLGIVMSPWWFRNLRVFGRFVPTAVWMGASLYDGLNPHATGASDMRFLESPDIWPLDELDQDRELTRRALVFVHDQPGRAWSWRSSSWLGTGAPGPTRRDFAHRFWPWSARWLSFPCWHSRAWGSGGGAATRGPGCCWRARFFTSASCTCSSPARCGTGFPASCPRWVWRPSG